MKRRSRILVVDDDPAIRASLRLLLGRENYVVAEAATPLHAMEQVRTARHDLILLDMNFSRATSGDEGMTLLKQIRIFRPDVPVILMTAWGSIPLAVEGIKAGAADFISKPWQNALLLERVAALTSLSREAEKETKGFDRSLIVGESPRMLSVIDILRRVSATKAPVLIMGENGTGKELVAETLHRNSQRSEAPFVKVNLGGISQSLFESEMFGHRKGAFTGAVADRKGRFEMAHGGTIFLDEIGDLDPASQVKMLRVLQEGTFEPLGSSVPMKVDVRVVSATNADLPAMVAARTFREDLFYRLNLITVTLPPLRERPGDIPLLVNRFAGGRAEFAPSAMELMQSLQWPGNIRELKNLVERAIIVCGARTISADDLRLIVPGAPLSEAPVSVAAVSNIEAAEKNLVVEALNAADGNISRAAASLGISRQTLYRRMEKFGIAAVK